MADEQNWHFPGETVSFLQALKANNNREWFMANKPVYENEVKKTAEFFCLLMTEKLEELTGKPQASKIYRIYRDVRFSKDKTPYNAHLHISFASEGAKMPAFFFGLQPEQLTLGAGTFGFEGDRLDAYRQRILGKDGEKLATILKKLESSGFRISEPALKRVPRGFDANHPHADLLRHKGLAGWYDFPDTTPATTGDAPSRCLAVFKQLRPLFDWLSGLR